MAEIKLWSPHFKCDHSVTATVAVMDKTPFDVPILLGNDIFENNKELCDVISVTVEQQWYKMPSLSRISNERHNDNVSETMIVDKAHAASLVESDEIAIETNPAVNYVTDMSMTLSCNNLTDRVMQNESEITVLEPSANHNAAVMTRSKSSNVNDTGPIQVLDEESDHNGQSSARQRAQQGAQLSGVSLSGNKHLVDADGQSTDGQALQQSSVFNYVAQQDKHRSEVQTNDVGTPIEVVGSSVKAIDTSKSDTIVHKENEIELKSDTLADAEAFRQLCQIQPDIINSNYFIQQTEQQAKFAALQNADPKLEAAFHKAKTEDNGFLLRNGILFKRKPQHIRSQNEYLLVLPDSYKSNVLKEAHDNITSGFHMGYKRTMLKIWRVFYIPKSEIKNYVASCEVCQRLAPKFKRERAELMVIPEIETDFGSSFVIDVMGGELNRLSKQDGFFKYVLICVDNATRFIELIPLKNLKAKTVADELLENLIARYRVKTLIFDQQSSLVGQLMTSVLKLLRVKTSIAIAGFHTKTALAERACRTVEKCLKPYIGDNSTNWRKLLPWVAFQLRQLPCETTGFSAHELVYGRNFPDSLADLKDDLIGGVDPHEKQIKTNVVSYINELRENVQKANQIARSNESTSRTRTKTL